MMKEVVSDIQSIMNLPLQIDSADAALFADIVRTYNGKPIINSVNGKEAVMNVIERKNGA
jgi:5-methyltetrahydrofolate--homocysteine methyltransferase